MTIGESQSDRQDQRRRLLRALDRLQDQFPTYPRRYLYILMLVGAIDSADRLILATVFDDVRRAFDVSDSQLGLLTGAYSLVAALSVLPFGWLTDRWNRVRLIALGFIPWGIAMIMTGLASTFAMMFGARLFLGTIEATNGPSTPSLLGDYYRVPERSRIMGMYGAGALFGALLGLAGGGILSSIFGWRATFVIWGFLGFACGLLVIKTLPEPKRGMPDAIHQIGERIRRLDKPESTTEEAPPPTAREKGKFDYRELSVRDATIEISRVKTMWFLFIAGAAGEFLMSGLGIWAPTFMRRYHGFSAAGSGIVVAGLALSTVVGIFVGARASDRMMSEGHPTRRIWVAALSNMASFGSLMAAFAIDDFAVVLPFFLLSGFLIGLPMAPLSAAALDTIVPQLRGRASALRSLLRVGSVALAPVLFGYLSDLYGLRSAMLFTIPVVLVSGLITMLAVPTYVGDMEHAQSEALRQHILEDDDPEGGIDDLPDLVL